MSVMSRYSGPVAGSIVDDAAEFSDVDTTSINQAATKNDGLGCHAGAAQMKIGRAHV